VIFIYLSPLIKGYWTKHGNWSTRNTNTKILCKTINFYHRYLLRKIQ